MKNIAKYLKTLLARIGFLKSILTNNNMDKKQLKKLFGKTLELHGLRRSGTTWYLESEEAVAVVNLQSSNFGEQYFINLASWLKCFGEEKNPKENKCPIRIRLTSAFPTERGKIESVFDLEHISLSDVEREKEAETIVSNCLIPFLEKLATLTGIRQLYKEGKLRKGLVHLKVKELFNDAGVK